MAQLVARDVWDVDAAGSNPVTPTKNPLDRLIPEDFLFIMLDYSYSKVLSTIPIFINLAYILSVLFTKSFIFLV